MTNRWTIVYHTSDSKYFPHIHENYIVDSNPDADILLADGSKYHLPQPYSNFTVRDVNELNQIKYTASSSALKICRDSELNLIVVRNHDKFLRDWLVDNYSKIETNNIAFFEWDVIVNETLPDIYIKGVYSKFKRDSRWCWFSECRNIFSDIKYSAPPFAAYFTSKKFIKKMINSKYDEMYNSNIFCEARISALIHDTKVKITSCKDTYFKNIHIPEENKIFKKSDILKGGIFHPIKKPINLT